MTTSKTYPVDCGVSENSREYTGKLPKNIQYIGNCIDTVDELEYWDTQEMSDCIYNSEIIDNSKLSHIRGLEIDNNCWCGINMEYGILWIYKEDEDIHYFYEVSELNECEGMDGCCHLNHNMNVGGMGAIELPHNGNPGSGDLPLPSGKVYTQVMPFDSFIKIPKRKKKRKLEKHSDSEHTPNAPMYDYVDDFRTYTKRTKISI